MEQPHSILRRLKQAGYRLTPQRTEIIRALLDAPSPLTARQVHRSVLGTFPHVSLDTVYRNLRLLTDLDVATEINVRHREESRFKIDVNGHHHHLVCLRCGGTVCIDLCPLQPPLREEARRHRFEVVGHAFEVYGYCGQCRPEERTGGAAT